MIGDIAFKLLRYLLLHLVSSYILGDENIGRVKSGKVDKDLIHFFFFFYFFITVKFHSFKKIKALKNITFSMSYIKNKTSVFSI
jgi:CO dehydrogenase/acetyl-CoA synthase epsilon subunit